MKMAQLVLLSFLALKNKYENKKIFRINVSKSNKPIFLKDRSDLVIRQDPRAISISGQKMLEYINLTFPKEI